MSEEVSVPLLPIHFLAPAWLYTRLTKDALAARGWSIATFETKRGCGFGLDSPPHQLGLVIYLSALHWSCLSFCIACESLQFWLFDQQSSSPQAVCMYFGQPPLALPSDIYLPSISVDERASTLPLLKSVHFLLWPCSLLPSPCCHPQHHYHLFLEFCIGRTNIYYYNQTHLLRSIII